jgi:hypothetical protein
MLLSERRFFHGTTALVPFGDVRIVEGESWQAFKLRTAPLLLKMHEQRQRAPVSAR